MVPDEVRTIEAEIDASIRGLPVWNVTRDILIRRLMTMWRDGLELASMMFAHAALFGLEEGVGSSLASEHMMVTGAYQALKWAMEYAVDDGESMISDEELVDLIMNVAAPYQVLVDSLKLAAYGLSTFGIDRENRTLAIYEGGDLSGYDATIVQTDHISVAFHTQRPLVDDADQLTSRWNAGEYRAYWAWLKPIAEAAETETIIGQAGPLAPQVEIMKRPVVLEIPNPAVGLAEVQRDLTFTREKARSGIKWKIDSWHDCPFIETGDRVFAVSSTILTLASRDDYMLRVAVLNDSKQYERVSGLREERMIAICREAFERTGWQFTPHYMLSNPAKEIDGFATRGDAIVIIQLKSTLRPQSPWEVSKRNADVIEGINHTAEIVRRMGDRALGIVVTDGYEGDYATWKASLSAGIPVATLEDISWIPNEPERAFNRLAERAGIQGIRSDVGMPERRVRLCGWTLRLVDEPAPGS